MTSMRRVLATACFALCVLPSSGQAATVDNTAHGIFQAAGSRVSTSNQVRAHLGQPTLTPTLALNTSSVSPGGVLMATIGLLNSGTAPLEPAANTTIDGLAASSIVVYTTIPAGILITSTSEPVVYHATGAPDGQWVISAPAAYDRVGVVRPNLNPGGALSFGLSLTVTGAPALGSPITLGSTVLGSAVAGGPPIAVTPVNATAVVGATGGGWQLFADNAYSRPLTTGLLGAPLFGKAAESGCVAPVQVTLRAAGGDEETLAVREVIPGSGVYEFGPVPTAIGAAVVHDGVLQGAAPSTSYEATLSGCPGAARHRFTLIDPAGRVVDARTGAPIAGATVRLLNSVAGTCGPGAAAVQNVNGAGVLVSAPNPVATGANGRFEFPLVGSGDYCVSIEGAGLGFPSAVAAGALHPSISAQAGASYGQPFAVNAATGAVVFDVPVDRGQAAVELTKKAVEPRAEPGQIVMFRVEATNRGSVSMPGPVVIEDRLPDGLDLLTDSVVVEEALEGAIIETSGQRLIVRSPSGLQSAARGVIRYGAVASPAAAGRLLTNTAFLTDSNGSRWQAAARVEIVDGVLGRRGYLIGTVVRDCNGNGRADEKDAAVAGARIVIESGATRITDSSGRYHFQGLRPTTHVVRVDPATVEAVAAGTRGGAGTAFVDLGAGMLHRQDFLVSCEAKVSAAQSTSRDELERSEALGLTVNLPAERATLQPHGTAMRERRAPPAESEASGATDRSSAIEEALSTAQAQMPVILWPIDGEVAPHGRLRIATIGAAGTSLTVLVNDRPVGDGRIGQRSTHEDGRFAHEYVGVPVEAGRNRIEVVMRDQFGNVRGKAERTVVVPGTAAGIVLAPSTPSDTWLDQEGGAHWSLQVVDREGVAVETDQIVDISAVGGARVLGPDANPEVPGIQMRLERGRGVVELARPTHASVQELEVRFSDGARTSASARFIVPDRDWLFTGLVDSMVAMGTVSEQQVEPLAGDHGFDQTLSWMSRQLGGDSRLGNRIALQLRGQIAGKYLVRAALDTSADRAANVYGSIDADMYYPVYGDASSGSDGLDGKLYVRVDAARSYVLYGNTDTAIGAAFRLNRWVREVTGARGRYEGDGWTVEGYLAQVSSGATTLRWQADGSSGPVRLAGDVKALSERVEIVVRDRFDRSSEVTRVLLQRYRDYSIDYVGGLLRLEQPLSRYDAQGNEQWLEITYSAETDQFDAWVGGLTLTTELWEGGTGHAGVHVQRDGYGREVRVEGVMLQQRLGEHTDAELELARSELDSDARGYAYRAQVTGQADAWNLSAKVARSDQEFAGQSTTGPAGQRNVQVSAERALSEHLDLVFSGRVLESDSETQHSQQAHLRWQAGEGFQLRGGLAHRGRRTLGIAEGDGWAGVVGAALSSEFGSLDLTLERPINEPGYRAELTGSAPVGPMQLIASTGYLSADAPDWLGGIDRGRYTRLGMKLPIANGEVFSEARSDDSSTTPGALVSGVRQHWDALGGGALNTSVELHRYAGDDKEDDNGWSASVRYRRARDHDRTVMRIEAASMPTFDSLTAYYGYGLRLDDRNTLMLRAGYEQRSDALLSERVRMQAGLAQHDLGAGRSRLMMAELRHEGGAQYARRSIIVSANQNDPLKDGGQLQWRFAGRRSWYSDGAFDAAGAVGLVGLRAMTAIDKHWDFGASAHWMFGSVRAQRAAGLDIGRRIGDNAWITLGYNLVGVERDSVLNTDALLEGVNLRLRWKFDESDVERFLQ